MIFRILVPTAITTGDGASAPELSLAAYNAVTARSTAAAAAAAAAAAVTEGERAPGGRRGHRRFSDVPSSPPARPPSS